MTEKSCKVKLTVDIVEVFLKNEEYCSVCRRNFNNISDLLGKIREGNASLNDLDSISQLISKVNNMCQCGKGKTIAGEVISLMEKYRDDYIVHIENRVCPDSECPKLMLAPCQAACPAGIDIPNYVAMIGMKRFEEAIERIKEDVPLPGSLGRICEHPCERACRRAEVDKAISICALKRLAFDKSDINKRAVPPERKYPEKVAVIGAGPAGLSAAYFLAQRGYGVTVFEAMSEPGGMLAYGIPPYRLPRNVLRNEIDKIKAMGVEIKLNTPITRENGIQSLKEKGYAAVFLGTGAWKGSIPLSNKDGYKNLWDGVSFLRTVNHALMSDFNEKKIDLNGKKVIVVGGGNVAIDAARVSLRLGAQEVRIVYRRTREEMPALNEEIVDAEKEGVIFDFLVSPVNVGGKDGQVSYLECLKNTLSEPDAGGRCKPVPIENSEHKIEADIIIFATGQKPELSYLTEGEQAPEVEIFRDRIVINPDTMETSRPGVFAGGDAVTGPASAIRAMAAGKRAAASIDAYLRGRKPSAGIKFPVKRKSIMPLQVSAEQKADTGRINFHDLYLTEKQSSFEEIMQGVSEEAAVAEAGRCLRCDMCIACGSCVDNCHEQVGAGALQLGYVGGSKGSETDFSRPGDKCIGCGTCSVNCPTGAITQEDKDGYREMRMCGALMSRLKLVACQVCGRNYVTEKHLEFVNQSVNNDFNTEKYNKNICPDCARKAWSEKVYGMGIS
ncbi:FAD-dependent oxidoreductase [Desulfolucanica intricata]|uniref:FAD-dependent oxidoreductase n=1 Tax=Desulfolucanica intricata TaxID=1285191 RepID=UPI000834FCFB|nr:FAD-dependent oxidoreductase [Desulfolucanica intricata]